MQWPLPGPSLLKTLSIWLNIAQRSYYNAGVSLSESVLHRPSFEMLDFHYCIVDFHFPNAICMIILSLGWIHFYVKVSFA